MKRNLMERGWCETDSEIYRKSGNVFEIKFISLVEYGKPEEVMYPDNEMKSITGAFRRT